MTETTPLLELQNISKFFPVRSQGFGGPKKFVRAVDSVSLKVFRGQTIGLVGESGCGKSTLGRLAIRLLDPTQGTVSFQGKNITNVRRAELRALRRNVQIVFQDPFSSLNPRMTVGKILSEPFEIHEPAARGVIQKRVQVLLSTVGLPEEAFQRFPHEFSGGQRQRIGIARAIALKPQLVVADEPVSALDVSIQSQILNLFSDLKKSLGLSYLFVSHDLSVIRHISDFVAVMYLGKVVEFAPADEIYAEPKHPYTQILLASVPQIGGSKHEAPSIEGDVPSPISPPSGCYFHTRCPFATEKCRKETPMLRDLGSSRSMHQVSCHYANA